MKFTPKSKDYQQKVQDSFDRQEFMQFIGATISKTEPGFCEIRVPYRRELGQQHGFFHAGIVSTIADNAAGYAAFSLMEDTSSVLTVEFKLNLMAPGDGDVLIGRSEVLKNGRTLTICRADVFVQKDGQEKLCAACQSTLIELRNSSDGPK